MTRLAHLSDIHIGAAAERWTLQDWFSKRLTSWINLHCTGRHHHFRFAEEVMAALMEDIRRRSIEHIIFSGDATALGFDSEFRRAAEYLQVNTFPGLAVPGNHDYCTPAAALSGHFERHFAPWQTGLRVDNEIYPFAQRVGPVWLVGVNSAIGNRLPWDAHGAVGEAQLRRLERLLAELEPGPRVLVTHFPVCRADLRLEPRHHGLRDLDSVLSAASRGGVRLWLHGHRHTPYILSNSGRADFPLICAGSATQSRLWSFLEYEIDETRFVARRRHYQSDQNNFCEGEEVVISI